MQMKKSYRVKKEKDFQAVFQHNSHVLIEDLSCMY